MKAGFLYLIGQLRAGGSERQLFYLLQYMDRERYRPAVAVWNFSEEDTYVKEIQALNVPVYRLADAQFSAANLSAFRSLVREVNPQIVHSYSFFTNIAVWWGTVGTKAIALGSLRGEFSQTQQDCGFWLGKLSARWPEIQVFNNVAAAEAVRSDRGIFAPQRQIVVRNGIDLKPLYRSTNT